MDNTKYNEFIKKYIPKEDKMKNEFVAFFFGGLLGLLSEILLELYQQYPTDDGIARDYANVLTNLRLYQEAIDVLENVS